MRSRIRILYLSLFTATFVLIAFFSLYAASTGQIKGTITDKETGKPIFGASVLVVGTSFGSNTDFDGNYLIKRLEPGTYTLQITHLEYEKVVLKEVIVQADMTTEQNLTVSKKVTDIGEEITVRAKHEILDKFKTSNKVTISRAPISHKPITTVDQLLNQVSGVVTNTDGEVYLRGGRNTDRKYSHNRYPHGGKSHINGAPHDAMFFKNYGVNPFVDCEDDSLSTFAIDVDEASYILSRTYLKSGNLPPEDAVRVEEFVNHFDYDYTPPQRDDFTVFFEGAPSHFGKNCKMLKIGIKGKEIEKENRKDANLIFVIDVSGSMSGGNRLGLVREALLYLVEELTERDKVGIVVYGSRGEVLLEPVSVINKQKIIEVISLLHPNGSTNAEEGINLGYKLADRYFETGKINRVILCSDGVANVGRTGPEEILNQIKKYADKGITLSSLGFGMGNYNDLLLEKLGNKGNGSYAYIDNLADAKKLFVDNLTGNLQVIARDVKIQVAFNPEIVRSYRLLGYENRDVQDHKFRDDTEDGGEIGAGHEVTALYELKLYENASIDELGKFYIRWKNDDMSEVTEKKYTITRNLFVDDFYQASRDFRLAASAAEFAEILRDSFWAKGSRPQDVMAVAAELLIENDSQDVAEFIGLIAKASRFDDQLASR